MAIIDCCTREIVPGVLWRQLFPGSGPIFVLALLVAAAGVLLILGIRLNG